MNLPITLNGEQQARLDALIVHGQPSIMIIDEKCNGADLYIAICRGESRDYVMAAIEGAGPEAERDALDPPAKVVAVSTGARTAPLTNVRPS